MIMRRIEYEPGYLFPGTRLTYRGDASDRINPGGKKKRRVICECSCDGNTKTYVVGSIRDGFTKSCGCLKREMTYVHGYAARNHPLYNRWGNMRTRCNNPNAANYHRYGGRGITVCPEWDNSFRAYAEWIVDNLGWPPNSKSQLDRKDNDGNYEHGNVQWSTVRGNANNRECSSDHPNVTVSRVTGRKAYAVRVHVYGCIRDTRADAQKLVEKFHAEFADDLARMAIWLDEAA